MNRQLFTIATILLFFWEFPGAGSLAAQEEAPFESRVVRSGSYIVQESELTYSTGEKRTVWNMWEVAEDFALTVNQAKHAGQETDQGKRKMIQDQVTELLKNEKTRPSRQTFAGTGRTFPFEGGTQDPGAVYIINGGLLAAGARTVFRITSCDVFHTYDTLAFQTTRGLSWAAGLPEQPKPPVPVDSKLVFTITDSQTNRVITDAQISIFVPDARTGGYRQIQPEIVQDGNGGLHYSVEPGIYLVNVARNGYDTVTKQNVSVRNGTTRLSIDLQRKRETPTTPTQRLNTLVLLIRNGSQGGLVEDAKISFDGKQVKPERARRGTYTFKLKPKTYEVTVEKEGFVSVKNEIVDVLDRVSQSTISLNPVKPVRRKNTLVLTIKNASKGGLVENANVVFEDKDVKLESGGNGVYTYKLKSGTYDVTVEKAGFVSVTQEVAVLERVSRRSIDLKLIPERVNTLVLTVKDAEKRQNIKDPKISILDNDVNPESTGNGVYRYKLKAGEYYVKVEKKGYESTTKKVDVQGRVSQDEILFARVKANVPKKRDQVLFVIVADARKQPIAGLKVIADTGIDFRELVEQNRYAFEVAPGLYELDVKASSGTYKTRQVIIKSKREKVQMAPVEELSPDGVLKHKYDRFDVTRDKFVDKQDFSTLGWELIKKEFGLSDTESLKWQDLRNFAKPASTANNAAKTPAPADLKTRLDINRDGKVNKVDFSDFGWEEIRKKLGKNDNDFLQQEDFDALAHSAPKPQPKSVAPATKPIDPVKLLYTRLDTNKNGDLEEKDFSKTGWQEMKKRFDKNNNDLISESELRSNIKPSTTTVVAVNKLPTGTLTIRRVSNKE